MVVDLPLPVRQYRFDVYRGTHCPSIRFRAAWKAQGHSVEELPFQAIGGVWGSILGSALIVLVLIAQFYVVSNLVSYSRGRVHMGNLGDLPNW